MEPVLQANVQFHIGFMPEAEHLNARIMKAYLQLRDSDFARRTHHFNGRYENLYLRVHAIPEIETVIQQALKFAAKLLQISPDNLRSGYWINDMGPGHATTRHDHVENDELLSGVYYVRVPDESGNLVIHDTHNETVVRSKEGMFVFFAPEVEHSVSVNNSLERRISIGMNFGPSK